jgi:hypothetical protein
LIGIIIPLPKDALSVATTHSEYFTAIAKIEETKSHNTLPSPPSIMPNETPYILPTPSVPARARKRDLRVSRQENMLVKLLKNLTGCKRKKNRRFERRINPAITVKQADKRLIVHIGISSIKRKVLGAKIIRLVKAITVKIPNKGLIVNTSFQTKMLCKRKKLHLILREGEKLYNLFLLNG